VETIIGLRNPKAPKRSQASALERLIGRQYHRLDGVGEVTLNDDKGEHLWAFDLAALREAFGKYVQEHKTTVPEWGEHAKLFLEKQRDHQVQSRLP